MRRSDKVKVSQCCSCNIIQDVMFLWNDDYCSICLRNQRQVLQHRITQIDEVLLVLEGK